MDEVVAAQQSLGRSLGKARAGEDKEISQKVREAGEGLANMLSGVLKMSRVHAADNKAFDSPVADLVRAMQTLDQLVGTVHVVTVDEHVYVNEVRLRSEGKPAIRELGIELKKHNVGGMSFHAPLDGPQVRVLVAALGAKPAATMPRTALRERFEQGGLRTIELHGIFRFRTSVERPSARPLGTPGGAEAPLEPGAATKPGAKAAPSSSASGVRGAPGAVGGVGASPSGAHAAQGGPSGPSGPSGVRPAPGTAGSGTASGVRAAPGGVGGSSASGVRSASGGAGAWPASQGPPPPGWVPEEPEPPPPEFTETPLSEDLSQDVADASFEAQTGAPGHSAVPAPAPAAVDDELPEAVLEPEAEEEPAGPAANPGFAMLERLGVLAGGAWDAMATGRTFSPLPLRRAVAEVLEIGADSSALWDAWVTGPTRTNHAVSVSLHALLLGQSLGLSVSVLQDLGVAALVHDIGYAALVGKPTGAGAEGLARHPGEGARLLLQQRGFSQAKVRRLRAVLDHHRSWAAPEKPSVLGAILRIADDYLTFLRVAGTQTTAVHVLGAMAQDQGALYQPALLQLFVNALGQFPPGVLLGLDDGRTVRSVAPVRSAESFASPMVRAVDTATGKTEGPQRDLGFAKVTAVYPG